jgi:hypothetical protein
VAATIGPDSDGLVMVTALEDKPKALASTRRALKRPTPETAAETSMEAEEKITTVMEAAAWTRRKIQDKINQRRCRARQMDKSSTLALESEAVRGRITELVAYAEFLRAFDDPSAVFDTVSRAKLVITEFFESSSTGTRYTRGRPATTRSDSWGTCGSPVRALHGQPLDFCDTATAFEDSGRLRRSWRA